ncbi:MULTISPECIES: hypothetical protein [Bartonella]|nr:MULTISPECIES: hypothetical protein [Bartonella]
MKIASDEVSITGSGENTINDKSISAYDHGFNQAILGLKLRRFSFC